MKAREKLKLCGPYLGSITKSLDISMIYFIVEKPLVEVSLLNIEAYVPHIDAASLSEGLCKIIIVAIAASRPKSYIFHEPITLNAKK